MLQICLAALSNPADESKFEGIYHAYKDMMYRVAYAILNNKEDAEDATQEAFLKLAKNLTKIDTFSGKKTKTYLVTLSRSVSIDMYRKFQGKPEKLGLDEVDNDTEMLESLLITSDILNEIVSDEGYQRIVGIIEEMSDTYKDVLKLRFVFEWSNIQIAEHLEITPNAVALRIKKGKAILAETLERKGMLC